MSVPTVTNTFSLGPKADMTIALEKGSLHTSCQVFLVSVPTVTNTFSLGPKADMTIALEKGSLAKEKCQFFAVHNE